MKKIIIEPNLFQAMLEKVENVALLIEKLDNEMLDKGLGEWMNNQDVCVMLNICPKTLQNYRDRGMIGFSRINNKFYYKPSEVDEFINRKNE